MKTLLAYLKNTWIQIRNWASTHLILNEAHWRWASYGIFGICTLITLGLIIDMAGVYQLWVMLAAIVFFLLFPFFTGLGARMSFRILSWLPTKYSWLFFGGAFFVLFLFRLPTFPLILVIVALLLTGAYLGASLSNLRKKQWASLSLASRILTLIFFSMGVFLLVAGTYFISFPGKPGEEVKNWAFESKTFPPYLTLEDPSLKGPFSIDSLFYGMGTDRRPEFGAETDIVTKTVDGSRFLSGWEKGSGKMRTRYWKMGPDTLALNGRVWMPVGEGPFPLVLMVHGNHDDREFSDPGYAYLGRLFASQGAIAVSVDQNFLNGAWSDFSNGLSGENDCRAWLLLKHLEQFREWNKTDSSRFYGKVDLEQVVLIGHSRGGEAVAIASAFNELTYYPDNSKETFDFNFGIRGVAAIAPVDGQYWPAGVQTPVADVNYFTLQGSMDGDLRSFHGLRQMRRVEFTEEGYNFASALMIHGANHGQFNQSWGIFDTGYPGRWFLNRADIMSANDQEKIAMVYLGAFLKECFDPGSGYLPLFKDPRAGRDWLPDKTMMIQFQESSSTILCDFEEDLSLETGTRGVTGILSSDMATWKEGRIPKRWGDLRNNGVMLGWNNETEESDSLVPGFYKIRLDSSFMQELDSSLYLCFLAGEDPGQPGKRLEDEEKSEDGEDGEDGEKNEKNEEGEDVKEDKEDRENGEVEEDDEEIPVDFLIQLEDQNGNTRAVRLSDYIMLQPPLNPKVKKASFLDDSDRPGVMMQYVALPLEDFGMAPEEIRSIIFTFDAPGKGMVILDHLGFTR